MGRATIQQRVNTGRLTINCMARAMIQVAWAVAVIGLAAQAETLYQQDGIELQGTARIVTYEAA